MHATHTHCGTFHSLFALLTYTNFYKNNKHKTQTTHMAPIHGAALHGDLVKMKRLVEEEGANPEEPDPSCWYRTPLHDAAWNGRDNVATYLLGTCGVDVDKVDDDNCTALYFAWKPCQLYSPPLATWCRPKYCNKYIR